MSKYTSTELIETEQTFPVTVVGSLPGTGVTRNVLSAILEVAIFASSQPIKNVIVDLAQVTASLEIEYARIKTQAKIKQIEAIALLYSQAIESAEQRTDLAPELKRELLETLHRDFKEQLKQATFRDLGGRSYPWGDDFSEQEGEVSHQFEDAETGTEPAKQQGAVKGGLTKIDQTNLAATDEYAEIIQELQVHKQNLRFLRERSAKYGALDTPIHLQVEVNETEKKIRELTKRLELISSGRSISVKDTSTEAVTAGKLEWPVIGAVATTILTIIVGIVINLLADVIGENIGLNFGGIAVLLTISTGLVVITLVVNFYFGSRKAQREKLIEQIRTQQSVVEDNNASSVTAEG